MSVTTPLNRKRIYLQRDYTEGTSVRFQNIFPQELIGQIETDKFLYTVNTINSIFRDAEKMSARTFVESCCACFTAYLLYCCFDSYYDRCLRKLSAFIDEQNELVWRPRGLQLTDPQDRGIRVIEITFLNERLASEPRLTNTIYTPNVTQHTAV
ncbi:Golgin subfamily A member 7 [Halotydeus destructor]|nr:Golgin subfamily A member 7 [Halotydeus destructor]